MSLKSLININYVLATYFWYTDFYFNILTDMHKIFVIILKTINNSMKNLYRIERNLSDQGCCFIYIKVKKKF